MHHHMYYINSLFPTNDWCHTIYSLWRLIVCGTLKIIRSSVLQWRSKKLLQNRLCRIQMLHKNGRPHVGTCANISIVTVMSRRGQSTLFMRRQMHLFLENYPKQWRWVSFLGLPLASLVMDEVNDKDDSCQDTEADGYRYSGVHRNVDAFLCLYTCTEHTRDAIYVHKRCFDWRYVALVVVLRRPALSASSWSSSSSASVTALRWEPVNVHV